MTPDAPCRSGDTDCEYARPPRLYSQNEEAWELWQAVQTQWRGAGLGIIGLDYLAVQQEADRMEIKLDRCTMSKIRALEKDTLQRLFNREPKQEGEQEDQGDV